MNEGSLLSDLTEQENATVSSEAKKLVAKQKQRAESDFVPMQSTRDTKTELFTFSQIAESDFVPMQSTRDTKTELSSSSYAAEDQKEHKPFFRMDWLHTKAGYVTTKGSLQRIPKKEENATMSSEEEKLVAMLKHRAESDFVPMQSTRDAKNEPFTSSHAAEDQKGSFYEDKKGSFYSSKIHYILNDLGRRFAT
ncbi:hypothetical protein EUGRSUZ_G00260 [Eucalyptus grandis]|uniref:Uncharacterized protein n=2 Tax=Eucalyptus grandis TaxID=71139 RepID=A0ACC3K3B4_EUCGR|nr:hypothetical protein EUGRSUZ_G00260 [Eucalyptus grandis]